VGHYERGSMRRCVCALVTLAWLGAAVDAGAAPLAPTKGSQLVTVYASGPCPVGGFNASLAFDQIVQPDGSNTGFTIPPKHVLVITDVIATSLGLTSGDVHFLEVVIGTPAHGNPVASRFEAAPSSGVLTATFNFPTGFVVKSTSTVCFQFVDFTHPNFFVGFVAIAHGFIAPDH
jgi:hypothetical protein